MINNQTNNNQRVNENAASAQAGNEARAKQEGERSFSMFFDPQPCLTTLHTSPLQPLPCEHFAFNE